MTEPVDLNKHENLRGRPRRGIVDPKLPHWIPRDPLWETISPETRAKLIADGEQVRP